MPKFLAAALLAVTSVTIGAAVPAGADRPPWFVDESKLPFTPLADAQALWGVHAGAGYRIEVPANWNGDLVLYAHGYRGEGPELTVNNSPIRNHLVTEGYAWAASSYRANGCCLVAQPQPGSVNTGARCSKFAVTASIW